MIAMSFLNEIRSHRKEKRDEAKVPDDYLKGLRDLGVTLPDGGEKIDEMDEERERWSVLIAENPKIRPARGSFLPKPPS
ncbi:MAG TPA: hypothetical protein DEP53_13800 [Bacteroidetes bacterium]|nr:hypothetical protein [Bacteroidota bacterium]